MHLLKEAASDIRFRVLQLLIILFAPAFRATNATLSVELKGNATAAGRQAWESLGQTGAASSRQDPFAVPIRSVVDYSKRSGGQVSEPLQLLQLTFNLTKFFSKENIIPVLSNDDVHFSNL